jgi:hypothetical protein
MSLGTPSETDGLVQTTGQESLSYGPHATDEDGCMSEMERIGESGRAADNLPESPEAEVGGNIPRLADDALAVAAKGLLGTVPIIGGFLVEVLNRVEQREADRQTRFIYETVRALGGDVESLRQLVDSDEDLAELWIRGFRASEDARTRDKLRLLAQVWVDASQGGRPPISSAHVVLSAVASLEEIHLEVLADIRYLADQPPPTEGDFAGLVGAHPEALEQRSRHDPDVLRMVLNDLAGKHLIRNTLVGTFGGMEGMEMWALTDLGTAVGRLLTVVISPDGDDEPG